VQQPLQQVSAQNRHRQVDDHKGGNADPIGEGAVFCHQIFFAQQLVGQVVHSRQREKDKSGFPGQQKVCPAAAAQCNVQADACQRKAVQQRGDFFNPVEFIGLFHLFFLRIVLFPLYSF